MDFDSLCGAIVEPGKRSYASASPPRKSVFLRQSPTLGLAGRIYVPSGREPRNGSRMARPSPKRAPSASEQLEALLGRPWPFPGRPPKHDLSTWRVTDDWSDPVPVTLAEVEVFERWFGDLFDELFSAPL